jgi:serine/threonine-protein kinase
VTPPAPAVTELLPGTFIGPYRLVERAGVGGMAEIWRALQPGLDRAVAVKILPRHYASRPGYLERFRREALAISRLDHPHVLSIYDFGEYNGFTYMVMPFIRGGTLQERLGRPWSVDEALAVLGPLAAALDCAHQHGIVHRDFKPSNVLVAEQGRVVLSDFGIARLLEGADDLTQAGMIIGTPLYMSPEQVVGRPATAASDLYALVVSH